MPQPLYSLMQQGELPAFSFLQSHGMRMELTSVFPTMSVVNDSSILTGTYPDEHRIPGLVWFNREEDRFVDYGDAMGNMIRQGSLRVARDAVFHLNDRHLSPHVETIHEYLAARGIPSASINLMVHRGTFEHRLRFPFDRILGTQTMSGPTVLRNGYFLKGGSLPFPNPFNQYGFSNEAVEQMTLDLMHASDDLRFIVTYLSDPDKMIHNKGTAVRQPLYDVDRFIQHILDTFPTWEEALRNWTIVVMGDSGQTQVKQDKERALISLPPLLSHYTLRGLSEHPENADLAVAANERMAYVYPLHDSAILSRLAERVLADDRIELVAYPERGGVHVYTAKGQLYVQKGGQRTDPYGERWEVSEGDPSILDVKAVEDHWEYGKYPDVFRQLYGAVYSQPPTAVALVAKPGYEFQYESSPTHVGGGSHGGISKKEMTVPLFIGGTSKKPKHNRLVDLKPFLIDCLE